MTGLVLLLLLAIAQVALALPAPPAAISGCKVGIIGAGPGGVYYAWRISVDTKSVAPADVCIFERSQRVGGRTHTLYEQGPNKDLTVEVGAYRFCSTMHNASRTAADGAVACADCEMCMPMMANLIQKKLGFRTEGYGSSFDGMVKIVNRTTGRNAGLSAYPDRLAELARAAGVRFFFGYHLDSLDVSAAPATTALTFAKTALMPAGANVSVAGKVLLNTPLMPTARIVRNSPTLKAHFVGGKYPDFLRTPFPYRHIKFYVHYNWAWWRQLGLTHGDFSYYLPDESDPVDSFDNRGSAEMCNAGTTRPLMSCSSDTMPLEGRYHDGDFRCDDGVLNGTKCRGFIEATYTSDGVHPSNVTYFYTRQTAYDPSPFIHVDAESSSDGGELLARVHARLIAKHKPLLAKSGLLAKANATLPTNAVLSMWDPRSPGFGAGTHGMQTSSVFGGVYGPGAAKGSVPDLTYHPFKTLPTLYIANEAFHPADWGEGSLEMAENAAAHSFNVPRPDWLGVEDYKLVTFGSSSPPGPPVPAPGACAKPTTKGSNVCVLTPDSCKQTTLACPAGQKFVKVVFASVGTPSGSCGSFAPGAKCHGVPSAASAYVAKTCLGKASCTVALNTATLNPSDPAICDGVAKSSAVELECGTGPPQPPPPAPPSPAPGPIPKINNCSGPYGADIPKLLQNRPSGTPLPDWIVMAAPFTPFHTNGSINPAAILPFAMYAKKTLAITGSWVMGMRGQFDALGLAEKKVIAAAWVAAGKASGIFAIIMVGSGSVTENMELARYCESIGADAIAAVGPYEELCSVTTGTAGTQCVLDFVAPVAAAAPKTPFFYYHTPGWNGKSINGVKAYDFFHLAETGPTKIPTLMGIKFESYSDPEFLQTCQQRSTVGDKKAYGESKVMVYAPCGSLGHWNQGTPGRGAWSEAWIGPSCIRIKEAWHKGDKAAMAAEGAWGKTCNNGYGNYVERYFYKYMPGIGAGADFGPPRVPQPQSSAADIAAKKLVLDKCGFFTGGPPK